MSERHSAMSEPRIPPRPVAEWDDAVRDALSVLAPPVTARPAAGTARPAREAAPGQPRPRRPVSNMVGIFCWHPALTKAFLTFNNHLFASTLPDRVREMVTVRVAWLRRGEYEWAQHVAMARAAGMSAEEISAISAGRAGPCGRRWTPRCCARSMRSSPTGTSAIRPGSSSPGTWGARS